MREFERELAQQAETSYVRMVRDRQSSAPKKNEAGASVTSGRAQIKALEG